MSPPAMSMARRNASGAAEDACHALVVDGRVVGMQLQADVGVLGDRQDALHEVGVGVPHRGVVVGSRIGVRQRLGIAIAVLAGHGASGTGRAGLVGAAGVPGERRVADAEAAQIRDELAEAVDGGVPVRQAQGECGRRVEVVQHDLVQLETGVGHPVADRPQSGKRRAFALQPDLHGLDAHRLEVGEPVPVEILRTLMADAEFHSIVTALTTPLGAGAPVGVSPDLGIGSQRAAAR